MEKIVIRNETAADYQAVEELTRKAFYNLYVPGCTEHYLVHIMREHADFIPELAFVLVRNEEIIGNIMYTKATLVDTLGSKKQILTFGPVCIAPEYQRKGYGKQLIEHSFQKATEMGYDTIVIFGSPANYVGRGFVSCRKHNICTADGVFPAAMMVKELRPGVLDGRKWVYHDSPLFQFDMRKAQAFDDALPPMEKTYQPSQEEFYIYSHSNIQPEL